MWGALWDWENGDDTGLWGARKEDIYESSGREDGRKETEVRAPALKEKVTGTSQGGRGLPWRGGSHWLGDIGLEEEMEVVLVQDEKEEKCQGVCVP